MHHVAVVDDEALICDIAREVLSDLKASVSCATSGLAAADMLRQTRFSLALIDLLLPEISGFDLAQIAVAEETPVLLMAGHPESVLQLTELGLPHLAKPFDIDHLSDLASAIIANSARNITQVKAGLERLKASRAAPAASQPAHPNLTGDESSY
jgi:DNA-binding response OmpR family regulator